MTKPRIAIVHYTASPIAGGVEVVMEAHASLFAENGYDVQVIAARGAQVDERVPFVQIPLIDSTFPENVKVSAQIADDTISPAYHAYKELIKETLRPALADRDVVLLHNVLAKDLNFPLTHAVAELAAERGDTCRFVSWVHDASAIAFDAPDWIKNTDKMPWRLINRPIPGVEYITLSRERQRELCELYSVDRDKITVVPDGVDMEQLLGLHPLSVRIWQDFELVQQDLVLFTPARIVHKKNIELGIEVVSELNQLGRKSKLIVTGPPSIHLPMDGDKAYYERIKRLARKLDMEDNIVFLYEYKDDSGNPVAIPPVVLRDMYLLSDMLFLSSLEEGFGMPLLEAGLLKTSVVCSNIAAFKEIGEEDVVYLDLGDSPREYALKILASVGSSPRRSLFKKILRHYTWESIFLKRVEPYVLHGPLPTIQQDRS